MQKYGVNELRRMFLEFFESKEHLAMKSFSLVPHNDNSLLLINSGMAPLKPYFTGQEIPPRRRVTTCQKCIRTGDIENIGKMRNRGYELKATVFVVRNSDRELSWSVTGGLIHNENKILEVSEALQDAQKDLEADQGANPNMLYKTGYSTNTIWVVRSLGIDPSTGRELYLDRFGEPTFTWDSRDLTACGVAEPKYQGNLSTMFRYKGFSANLSFGYRFGGQLYNSTLIEKVENTDFRENVDARVYKGRWQKAGDIAAFKGLHLKDKTSKTSRFVENERVFNCQSVTLQYLFDSPRLKKIVGMENLTLNVSTSDLFYISSVKRERGTAYPFSRQFSFSLSATF